jgi:hypothetical protein
MANNNGKKPPANLPTKDGNANRRGGRRQNQNQWNHTGAVTAKKFEGKTPELKGDIFTILAPRTANFHKVVKNIADYLQLEHGSNVSKAVRTLTLPPDSEIPEPPTTTLSSIDEYLWKEKHKNAVKFKENMQKAYIIIFHQFTPSLKNNLEAADSFPPILSAQDQSCSASSFKTFDAPTIQNARGHGYHCGA